MAWIEEDRGVAIADRATLAVFMDEEAQALARSAVKTSLLAIMPNAPALAAVLVAASWSETTVEATRRCDS